MNQINILLNKNEIDDVANFDRSLVEERNERIIITILKISAELKVSKSVLKPSWTLQQKFRLKICRLKLLKPMTSL